MDGKGGDELFQNLVEELSGKNVVTQFIETDEKSGFDKSNPYKNIKGGGL